MARHKHHKRPQSPTNAQSLPQNVPQSAPKDALKEISKEIPKERSESTSPSAQPNNRTGNQAGNPQHGGQTGNPQHGNQQRRDERRPNDQQNRHNPRKEQPRSEHPRSEQLRSEQLRSEQLRSEQPRTQSINEGKSEQKNEVKLEQKSEQKPEQSTHQQPRGNERGQQREFQPRQPRAEYRSDNRTDNRNEPRPDRSERPERTQPFGRSGSEQRTDGRYDNRSEFRPDLRNRPSRPPAAPDFMPSAGGFEKPEDVDDFAVRRGGSAYEPYIPKTPAKGSDTIFYKDFSPLFVGSRGLAIKILSRLDQSDSYLDKLVEYELANSDLKPLDRALLTEIVNGVTRWQAKLDWVLTGFYHGEFVKCIVPVKNAMRIALYQIMFLQKIPPFAAVNESVELVKRLKGPRSANLVNAILRNILHNLNNIRYPQRFEDVPRHLSVIYSHPFWLTKRWFDRFGEEDAEALLRTNNERPKITLRLNMMRCNRQELLNFLDEQQIKYWESSIDAERLLMVGSLSSVRDWKPFQEGWFSVQDPSAAMVVKLANPQPGQLIYDVCSAPGGKATFAAELTNDSAKIVAMDKYAGKLHLIEENAKRLRLTCISTQAQDIRHFKTKELADLVLVDAPCSGLGTLAKKPDIKWKFDLVHFPANGQNTT